MTGTPVQTAHATQSALQAVALACITAEPDLSTRLAPRRARRCLERSSRAFAGMGTERESLGQFGQVERVAASPREPDTSP